MRDSCLEDVGSCDLYVLIVGTGTGSSPPQDNPEGLSITRLETANGPGSAAFRGWRCCVPSIPDVRLSDLAGSGQGAAGARRSGMRWPAQVRAAEFSDLRGLIQALSTGVQAELDKLDKRSDGHRAGGLALRLAPRPPVLAGREELLAGA